MGLKNASLALLLGAIAVGHVNATPKETHKLGVEAIEAGRWADAERFFRAAMAERPQEKFNRLLKTAYLPHYYLGVALAELEQCQAALDSLAESNRQAQVQKSDHGSDLASRQQSCRDHLRQVETARAEVEQLLITADEAAAALTTLRATPELAPLWDQGSPSFGSKQQSAEENLANAHSRYKENAPRGELERLEAAKSLATSAIAKLNTTLSDARQRLGELNAAIATALEQLEEVETSARRMLRSTSDLAPYPRRLGSRVAAVDRTLNEVRDSKTGASAPRLAELTDELNTSVAALRRAARRPPKALTQAVEAFLGGAYADALTLLDTPSLAKSSRAKPHVCLIKAASHHGLWVLGGEHDDGLLDLATDAVIACAEGETETATERLLLSPKFFSPRFVEFHNGALQAQARAAELDRLDNEGVLDTGATTAEGMPEDGGPESGLTPDGTTGDLPADDPPGNAGSAGTRSDDATTRDPS